METLSNLILFLMINGIAYIIGYLLGRRSKK